MVLLVTTPTILAALETVPSECRETLKLPGSPAVDAPISHEQLIVLARWYTKGEGKLQPDKKKEGEEREEEKRNQDRESPTSEDKDGFNPAAAYTLNSLLRGTKVYVPPPPPKPEPSPEYLALKARLQAAAETDAYNRLLSSPPSTPGNPGPEPIFTSSAVSALHDGDTDTETDPLTPSLVINIFLSILLTGFSSYWALSNFRTPAFLTFASSSSKRPSATASGVGTASQPVRVLVSLFAGLFIGIAEVVVYASYLRKVDEAKRRERGIKERKEVVGPVVGGEGDGNGKGQEGEGSVEVGKDDEKEEIWGRGVNGGMRRRVRERWEERERGKEKDERGHDSLVVHPK